MPEVRSVSPWWVLLLLPVGLLVGWLVGNAPVPRPPEPKAAASQAATAGPPRTVAARPRIKVDVEHSDPAPAMAERPAEEPPSDELSEWTTMESAIAESQRNGKPVLIDFNAEWCGPCRAMKEEVFEDASHGRLVQRTVIPVSIVDRRREDGSNPREVEDLQQRYGVEAFPTLVVFSPRTGRSISTRGYGNPEGTLAWIAEAAKEVR